MEHTHNSATLSNNGFFSNLLQEYVPRRQCMFHDSELIALHIFSDFLIAVAYYSIPVGLVYFARRRKDLAYNWMFFLFALFIILCGTTHIFGIVSIWHTYYRLDGLVKLLTGLVSVATAILLWRLMPQALALPSQEELVRRRDELEMLVEQRTAELKHANDALKESEEKYRLLAEKAEADSQTKSEFLANMSHELRTPMNAVIGLSHILAATDPLTAKQQDYINTLQLSANSLLAIINDLLDISKIEARTLELERIPFSVSDVIHEVIHMMEVEVKEKRLTLITDMACVKERLFIGDPLRLRQIIMNLYSNAVKFTPTGSITISVTCEPTTQKRIEKICIAVKDTGIGITPDKLEGIFDKFVQADTSINRKYGGTGLGLAISKTLAEIMNGTLTAESNSGKGSTFTLCIPLSLADASQRTETLNAPSAPPTASSTTQCTRVLLVEDHTANVLVAGTYLEQYGYSYDVASNGAEALEKFKTGNYAAVLMDLQMPDMNGLEATQHIRAYEREHSRPPAIIIAITAYALQGDRDKCLAAGMDGYISKPFKPEEFYEKLTALQAQKRDDTIADGSATRN